MKAYTVFVKYKEFVESCHPMIDGHWVKQSAIMKVADLCVITSMVKNPTKIKVLEIVEENKVKQDA